MIRSLAAENGAKNFVHLDEFGLELIEQGVVMVGQSLF
jgi:hypothetical protein